MLVLSRKVGQQIHIGSDIIITVLEISGKLLRVGVDAPDNITILRGEIKDQIELENKLAACGSKSTDKLKKLVSLFSSNRKK